MLALSMLLMALLVPGGLVALGVFAQAAGWGLFNHWALPLWATMLITVAVFDIAVYAQHALMHRVPWLWALHRVHHSEDHLDFTSAIRFHPFELGLSLLYKGALVLLLGAPWQGILLFEVLLSSVALFSHSNVRLPRRLEAILRWVLVTPDMHRWHHEHAVRLQRSQYGSLLSIWDRLLGMLKTDGSAAATRPGLAEDAAPQRFLALLKLRFRA